MKGFTKKPIICELCHKNLADCAEVLGLDLDRDTILKHHLYLAHKGDFMDACVQMEDVCRLAAELAHQNSQVSGMTALKELAENAAKNFQKIRKIFAGN